MSDRIHESEVSFKSPGAIISMIAIAPLVLLLAAFVGYGIYNVVEFVIQAVLGGPA